jgi:S-disulfanyl-L-cysteine oxidoreductase SoxD
VAGRLLRVLGAACILAQAARAHAQQPADSSRSTRSGVYSPDQASRGAEIYALSCASCHTAATHTGPAFAAKWGGLTLAELYEFIRGAMPKNDPGSLSAREYLLAMTYLLQMNGMPAGANPLPSDSTALGRIRIDFGAGRDTTPKR